MTVTVLREVTVTVTGPQEPLSLETGLEDPLPPWLEPLLWMLMPLSPTGNDFIGLSVVAICTGKGSTATDDPSTETDPVLVGPTMVELCRP